MHAASMARTPARPVWKQLWAWVFAAMAAGILLGACDPDLGVQMQPLGTGFIKLITMFIGPLIFCTMISGMARMASVSRLGAVAWKTLVVFQSMVTVAMLLAFLAMDILRPGDGLDLARIGGQSAGLGHYVAQSHEMKFVPFLLDIIPTSFVGAFVGGNMLQVVFVSILCGVVVIMMGDAGAPITRALDVALKLIYGVIRIVMYTAPIGAFGAIAFGVGKFGIASTVFLARFIGDFYLACAVIFGVISVPIAMACGFRILGFLRVFRDEILICVATTSSEVVLPRLIDKLEQLGCDRSVAGVVLPTGLSFNPTGTSTYIVMVLSFLAQAIGAPLHLGQQFELYLILNLTARSAVGIAGSAFVVLVGTVGLWGPVPIAATGIILGIHRILAQAFVPLFAFTNVLAALAVARWEGLLDRDRFASLTGIAATRRARR